MNENRRRAEKKVNHSSYKGQGKRGSEGEKEKSEY